MTDDDKACGPKGGGVTDSESPNLRFLVDRQSSYIDELKQKVASLERQSDYWREQWEAMCNGVGNLIHNVRAREKGRRFATVVDLQNLYRCGDDLDESKR